MEKEYDLLVFIGRLQPPHKEHVRIIQEALEKSTHVLLLLGSAGSARTIRNPFTYSERRDMVNEIFRYDPRLIIRPLFDKTYNDSAWIKQAQDTVRGVALDIKNDNGYHSTGIQGMKIALIGAAKDHTSYYLKMFPQWGSADVAVRNPDESSTAYREEYFDNGVIKIGLDEPVFKFLRYFADTDAFDKLCREYDFVRNYKQQWEASPYPVKHVTVDAVVEQSGHVLLVKRKAEPGKGLWALPGGHLNEFETFENGMLRELREETKLKVPDPVLKGSIVDHRTFDDPYRSTLGRVITQAYHIRLRDETTLPKVKGSDDAEKAAWIPINELREDMLFDDHFAILQYFLGV